MIVDSERKLTLRYVKEEGNYASLSKLLRYGGKRYTEEANLTSLYKLLKEVTEDSNCYMYFNDKWEYATKVFKILGIAFNKNEEIMKDDE